MNENIKIAKELVKIAKSLTADINSGYLFQNMHDVEVQNCSMMYNFDESVFKSDYEEINCDNNHGNIYLYGKAKGKKPYEIFDLGEYDDDFYDYCHNWKEFFQQESSWLNNITIEYKIELKAPYKYRIARGYSQSDVVQVIYDSSQVSNPKMFDDFFWGCSLDLVFDVDGENYDAYELDYNHDFYDKTMVIESIKNKLGGKFDDDIKRQLEQQLPNDNDIQYYSL